MTYEDIRKGLRFTTLPDGTALYIQDTGMPAMPYRCWTIAHNRMTQPSRTSAITEAEEICTRLQAAPKERQQPTARHMEADSREGR